MFDTTVIESKPERVVSIGYTEGDYVLALGVTPVAVRDWYGDQPGVLAVGRRIAGGRRFDRRAPARLAELREDCQPSRT